MPARISEEDAIAQLRAAGLEPIGPYVNATTPWHVQCVTCGKTSTPTLTKVRKRGRGCKFCSYLASWDGRRISPEEAEADLAAAKLEPLEPYPGLFVPWLVRCRVCGVEGRPRLANIRTRGTGCIPCGRERAADAIRLPVGEALRTLRDAGLVPLDPYSGHVDAPWRSLCLTCDNEVTPRLSDVRRGQGGCYYCSGKYPISEEDAAEWFRNANLEPVEAYPGSTKQKWRSLCMTCGSTCSPVVKDIQRGQGGCRTCHAQLLGERFRRDQDVAAAEMLQRGFEPLEPYINRHQPWRCRCTKCGTTVSPTLGAVLRGSGCRECAEYGYSYEASGYLYLLRSGDGEWVKFGITNSIEDRLRTHRKAGTWLEVVYVSPPMTGEIAARIEKQLKALLGSEPKHPGRVDGWTESTPATHADLILELITEQLPLS